MAKNTDHDCEGMMCFHPSHFEDGGEVHSVKGNPVQDPDPEKAKGAMAGADSGGPSMSQAWQNMKNELGFGDQKSNSKPAGYAEGGNVRSGKDRHENEKGVHQESHSYGNTSSSHAGRMVRSGAYDKGMPKTYANKMKSGIKEEHNKVLSENRQINPNLKGLAHGGEVEPMDDMDSIDHELMESCGHECMEAMKKGDVKSFIDAIKAIVMSCK